MVEGRCSPAICLIMGVFPSMSETLNAVWLLPQLLPAVGDNVCDVEDNMEEVDDGARSSSLAASTSLSLTPSLDEFVESRPKERLSDMSDSTLKDNRALVLPIVGEEFTKLVLVLLG